MQAVVANGAWWRTIHAALQPASSDRMLHTPALDGFCPYRVFDAERRNGPALGI